MSGLLKPPKDILSMSDFKQRCDDLRKEIKETAKKVQDLKNSVSQSDFFDETENNRDQGEIMANLTLTFRHLEDASMRIGKVIQAYDGGVSIYDKITVGTTPVTPTV